ncbi:hypothetical protein NCS52_01085800 [Fusarium sp. LHS14.1]|nr:hypothetical protein NCS52_01085800 [Fusarium sp. LHS14.1]
MSSNTTFTYTAAAGMTQFFRSGVDVDVDVDAPMLLRLLQDTSSVQDRLLQGADAQDAQANDDQTSDIELEDPRAKL